MRKSKESSSYSVLSSDDKSCMGKNPSAKDSQNDSGISSAESGNPVVARKNSSKNNDKAARLQKADSAASIPQVESSADSVGRMPPDSRLTVADRKQIPTERERVASERWRPRAERVQAPAEGEPYLADRGQFPSRQELSDPAYRVRSSAVDVINSQADEPRDQKNVRIDS